MLVNSMRFWGRSCWGSTRFAGSFLTSFHWSYQSKQCLAEKACHDHERNNSIRTWEWWHHGGQGDKNSYHFSFRLLTCNALQIPLQEVETVKDMFSAENNDVQKVVSWAAEQLQMYAWHSVTGGLCERVHGQHDCRRPQQRQDILPTSFLQGALHRIGKIS